MDAATAELISHPLFSALSTAAQRSIRDAAVRRRVRRLEVIYAPGWPGDAMFWIRRGRVKVSRLSLDGREITLCLCHAGDVFGEESLVSKHSRSCQAQALDDASLLSVPSVLIHQLLHHEAAFGAKLAGMMAQRRERAEEQIENMAFRDVGGRLARLLLSLAAEQGSAPVDGRTLLNSRLTHQELANFVGTTRETLTLTIDRFKADGWIRFEGRMIAICEPDALQARANSGRWPREEPAAG